MFLWMKEHHPNPRISRKKSKCRVCGEGFEYLESERPNAQYCSVKCKQADHGNKVRGQYNGRYTGDYSSSVSFRNSIRSRFANACMICGWAESSCDVCHIVAKADGGEDKIENIIMLCPNHHRMYDNGLISQDKMRVARTSGSPMLEDKRWR